MRTVRNLLFFMVILGTIYAEDVAVNNSVRPEAQLKTIDIFAEALYWYTSETVDWAFTRTINGNTLDTRYKTFVFRWAPGFRVGLGYNMKHDQWDTRAWYTWFQSKATAHTKGLVTPAFLAARLSLLEPFSKGSASLNLHYNMFDWDLGRAFLASKYLSFRPAIGLKGGWITQTIHSYWTTPNFLSLFDLLAKEKIDHTFRGGGPKGGITGKWSFGNIRKSAFSLIGEADLSYLWGRWSIRDQFIDNLHTSIRVKTSDRNFGSFVVHGFLGFGWDTNFNHDRAHAAIKLGYEVEDWFNQFQIFSDTSGSQNNDLILQGINLALSLDF